MATKKIQVLGRLSDPSKQNKLGWVTEADLDAMIAGTYEGVEDEAPVEIVGSTITMQDGASGLYYSLYVEDGELKMEVV